ncbi:MAG TPA: hypothetical protein PLF16_02470 [Candidatus Staskawiczbacteria bacterium]|nr:hypothetical protein [Candidatus Staskawiczbacteria bacterium]
MKTILVDAVWCFIIKEEEGFKIFDEMRSLLDSFENPKIILTGANDEQIKMFNLQNMPYPLFTLKHNPEKTNPEYYKILLGKFNLTAEDVIYFEHDINAVKSAESMGIKSYYYDQDRKDLEALEDFLIKNTK